MWYLPVGVQQFTAYISPLSQLIYSRLLFSRRRYATICTIFNRKSVKMTYKIREWLQDKSLKLNDQKTVVVFLASNSSGATYNTSSCIRIFDVLFDISFTMAIHVCALCRTAYMSLNNNSPIRRNLAIDATMSLVHIFIISSLGEGIYCFIILFIEHDIGVCVRPHNIS